MTHTTTTERAAELTRPIIGIENRTAQEVFDIMADRIRSYLRAISATPDAGRGKPVGWILADLDGSWTKDPELAEQWRGMGWEVHALFAHPPALPVGAEPSNLQKVQSASQGLGQQLCGSRDEVADSATAALAPLYRKTALVSAEQFLPAENNIPAGVRSSGMGDPCKGGDYDWVLDTLEGAHTLRGGDYICTGPAGERWNVAREIFEATYELATPTPPRAVTVSEEMVKAVIEAVVDEAKQAARYLAKYQEWEDDGEGNLYRDGFEAACDLLGVGDILASHAERHKSRILTAITAALSAPMGDQGALVDRVWSALKVKCCAHKPDHPDFDSVKRVVMVSKDDLAAALAQTSTEGGV